MKQQPYVTQSFEEKGTQPLTRAIINRMAEDKRNYSTIE